MKRLEANFNISEKCEVIVNILAKAQDEISQLESILKYEINDNNFDDFFRAINDIQKISYKVSDSREELEKIKELDKKEATNTMQLLADEVAATTH